MKKPQSISSGDVKPQLRVGIFVSIHCGQGGEKVALREGGEGRDGLMAGIREDEYGRVVVEVDQLNDYLRRAEQRGVVVVPSDNFQFVDFHNLPVQRASGCDATWKPVDSKSLEKCFHGGNMLLLMLLWRGSGKKFILELVVRE